ncbi:hypothetical protein ACIP5T_03065 [Microbacterium sp. NPDC088619]|uniref:hypothetical protein n=1 Tax=Microbacterium sp. NPDC088619 TaxID=3364196 RepID=UPI0038305073
MFTVNGVSLDNNTYDWRVMSDTRRRSQLSRDRASLRASGRDGVVAGLGATVDASMLSVEVETPTGFLEALLALVGDSGVIAEGSREAAYETVATPAEDMETATPRTSVSLSLRLPGAFWRDVTTTTTSEPLGAASVPVSVFGNISAPVADAVIRVQGAATAIRVTDSSGAWVTLPNVTAGQWVRFDSATGKAFITTSAAWSGGTDVSGQVDFGGPRGVFEITPIITPGNPAVRFGQVAVSTATRSGASIDIRGKAAYLL